MKINGATLLTIFEYLRYSQRIQGIDTSVGYKAGTLQELLKTIHESFNTLDIKVEDKK